MFTAPEHRRLSGGSRSGLTLLEVVVGLTILALISGAIHAIVSGSVEATATLARIEAENRRVETFLARCRDAFAHLPSGATVELRLLESDPIRQELTLRGVPEAFAWGEHGWWDKAVVTLAPQPWPDDEPARLSRFDARGAAKPPVKRFAFSMTVPDFFKTNEKGEPEPDSPIKSRQGHQLLLPDKQGRFWFELLPEIERVEWRFYDPGKKVWLDQHPAGRPPMIELKLALPGRKLPMRALFQTNL
jgi:prepilin-type N-terminal cleavage/methylation domain-containing protein